MILTLLPQDQVLSTAKFPKNFMVVVSLFQGEESAMIGISKEHYQSSVLHCHHLNYHHNILIAYDLEGLYPAIFQRTPILNIATLHSAPAQARWEN